MKTPVWQILPISAEHVLDWFHITMRLTVLGQYAKGLAHHDEEEAQNAERELKRIKGYLWNGNHRAALACTGGLIDELEDLATTYPGIKAFRKGVDEFHTYVTCNAHTIPHYAERYRYGERVSTAFVESTVNTVVGKRFSKRRIPPVSTAGREVRSRGCLAGWERQREMRAGLCGQGLVAGGLPVPGQQLVHAGVRQRRDAPEDIGEADLAVMRLIDEIHLQLPFYGSRRKRDELEERGHTVNRKRVQRLMRQMGLRALYPRRRPGGVRRRQVRRRVQGH